MLDAKSEALRCWALELISPTDGRERRAFARRATVERAVGKPIVQGLEDDGLVLSWDLGRRLILTPWGYESGELLCLTPLGAKGREVELDERPERAVVDERISPLRPVKVRLGRVAVPYWRPCGQIAGRPRVRRGRDPDPDRWMELIEDRRQTEA